MYSFPVMWNKSFTEHPASVGETYGEHMAAASGFGFRMIAGGMACLVHALLPFLCEKSASVAVAELHDRMVANRRRPASSTPAVGRPSATVTATEIS